MRAVIAGAGIGGLTTALSLHAAGVEASVVEGGPRVGRLGVGINLLPHAVRELTELGLGDALAATAIPTGEMVHFDRHGGRIWGEPRGRALGYDWPQYSIHRGDLQQLLHEAVRSRLGDVVRTGVSLTSFEQSTGGVRALLTGEKTVEADVLVGADGLHSRVRAQLHPGEPPPLWNGIRMWRGVAEGDPVLSGRTLAVAGSNTRAKFVVYPISRPHEERGRALLNWVAEVRLPDASAGPAEWDRTGSLDEVLPHYADWRFDWLDVPALIAGTERILQYPMVDRDPLPFWSQGRVTLVGDAAHPMYPIGSNGGSQAILDARVLAYELARSPSVTEGLTAYDKARREQVNAIVLANREMPADRVLHTVAERAPDGFARIEDVLGPAELATITGAYKQTSFADVETLNTRPSWTP
ncbi:flavin-dependent oxidoreductase [Actinomadura barringtoniae]|uniref:Flavin-dependent oxidoreductase n=1 Tax=Actinomadura barringtoniae TaxID=1427535 RepID=A0A939TE99_9ACTN|nr:flavin-dependent oxidoreductase [Actinomadura barringtoniae]MBO2453130.1 flavin-dependent oxidoreductase [Actinomadura barringtoniae]